ncbi:unnamed protein product, partial [Ixodes hexagonus]
MLATFVFLSHNLLLGIMVRDADHWCRPPPEYANLTSQQWRDIGVPRDASGYWHKCLRYDPPLSANATNRSLIPCEDWDYDLKGHSIITQWNLVCHRRWLLALAYVGYMSGAAVAAPIMGALSDKIGRRTVIYMSVVSALISGMAVCFASSFPAFVALRFWVSASVSTVQITSFVLLFELSTPAYQCLYSVITISVAVIAAPLFLSVVGVFAHEWVLVQLAAMMPTSLLLSTFILTVESPVWLVTTMDFLDAERVLIRAARINDMSIHEAQRQWRLHNVGFYCQDGNPSSCRKSKLLSILRSRIIRRRLVIAFWCWYFVMVAYYHTHRHQMESVWVQAAKVTVEEFGSVLLYFSATKLGRRVTLWALLVAFSVFAGMKSVTRMLQLASGVVLLVSTAARIVLDMTAVLLYAYSVELFPTVVRSVAMCAAYFLGRIGGITAPFLQLLAGLTHQEIVPSLLSVLGIFTALAVRWLPETMSVGVMNTLWDVEDAEMKKELRKSSSSASRTPISEMKSRAAS